ncbi:MAG: DMT family transporter [Actinomycetota bacterium]|nr:DMT family transporter [Actinomycetota bacterium]
MAVVLSLASALVYGAADFCGGLAARRASVFAVVALSQFAGLVLLLVLLPFLGGRPTGVALAWGAAAGLAGGTGLGLFYRALGDGVMSVVAPVTALCAAAIPVLVGLLRGERLAVPAAAGIAIAFVAVALVASEGGVPSWEVARRAGLFPALAAGSAFGVFFVLLAQTRESSGLWPLVGARAASIGLIVSAAAVARRSVRAPKAVLPVVVLAGAADMAANALFLLATREGLLVITGVLASLYPVSTVILAQLVLRERLAGSQLLGLSAATLAVVLIALPA